MMEKDIHFALCFSLSQIISPKLQFLLTRKIVMVLIFCLKDEFLGILIRKNELL